VIERKTQMMVLVTGGSGSGKSEYAENRLLELRESCMESHLASLYIATMFPFDEESKLRVRRHQSMRAKKKFETIECYTNLKKLSLEKPSFILLECISNLIANERYQENGCNLQGQALMDYVVEEVQYCMGHARHMVVVTNEVNSDGISYDDETTHYQKVLGVVNQRLAQLADEVWEVVCGIPIQIK